MSDTSRRGFFRTLAAGIAAIAAGRAAIALPAPTGPVAAAPAVPLPRGARMHAALKEMLGDDIYVSWFPVMEVGEFDGHTLHASVPVKFLRNWIEHHYSRELLAAARTEFASVQQVELTVRARKSTRITGTFKWWNKKHGFGHFVGQDGTTGWIRLKKSYDAELTQRADRLRLLITPGDTVTLLGAYAIDPTRGRWEIDKVIAGDKVVPVDTHIVFKKLGTAVG